MHGCSWMMRFWVGFVNLVAVRHKSLMNSILASLSTLTLIHVPVEDASQHQSQKTFFIPVPTVVDGFHKFHADCYISPPTCTFRIKLQTFPACLHRQHQPKLNQHLLARLLSTLKSQGNNDAILQGLLCNHLASSGVLRSC